MVRKGSSVRVRQRACLDLQGFLVGEQLRFDVVVVTGGLEHGARVIAVRAW
jgi:hypothetical protein